MKVFPLIYSRILKDDYPNGFLARPEDLDVSSASKYVIPAMENIMYVGGIRHAVFSAGDYLVYGGVACVAENLVKRILKSRIIDFPYEEYQADKAGRPLIFFIGFAVRKFGLPRNELPDIDLYGTYRVYLSYLVKQWHNDKAVTDISEGLELKVRPYIMKPAPLSLEAGGKRILRNYREDDFQEVIDYHFAGMAWGHGGDFSFLSNVLPDDAAQSPFANISAYNCSPEECARRMGISGASVPYAPPVGDGGSRLRTNNVLNKPIAGVDDDSSDTGAEPFNTEKKTSPTSRSVNLLAAAAGVLAVVAIIALLLFLLVRPKKSEASRQNQTVQAAGCSTVLEQLEKGTRGSAALQTGEVPGTIGAELEDSLEELLPGALVGTAEKLLETPDNVPLGNTGNRI